MPTTTWSTARADISRPLGFIGFTTSTNITTNTSVVSTELADDFDQDDYLIGWFIRITSGNNADIVRRVTDYTASSGTLTVAGANLSAESGGVTCELTRFNSDSMENHFNRASAELFPQIALVRNVETIVTGQRQHRYTLPSTLRGKPVRVYLGQRIPADSTPENEITDPGFELWDSTTALTNWTLSGTNATVNQESETTTPNNYAVLQDQYSARLVTADSGVTTLLQTVTPTVAVQGQEANVAVWVYCMTASRVAARCGSTAGDTHGGTGWERLEATENQGVAATTIAVGITVTSGSSIGVYVDEITLSVGQSEPLGATWEEIEDWTYIPPIAGASNNGLLEFNQVLPAGRRIRIVGRAPISTISSDSSTIEVDTEQLIPLYDYTRMLMAQDVATVSYSGSQDYWRQLADRFEAQWRNALDRGVGVRLPNPRPRSLMI